MLRDADMIYEGVLGEFYRREDDDVDVVGGNEGKATTSSLCLGAMISYPLKL